MKEKEIDIVLWKVATNLAALILSKLKKECNVKSILTSLTFTSSEVNKLFQMVKIPSDIFISLPISEEPVSETDTLKKIVSVNDMLFNALADNATALQYSLTTYFYNALVKAKEDELYAKVVGDNNAIPLDVNEIVSSLKKEQNRRNYSGLTSL